MATESEIQTNQRCVAIAFGSANNHRKAPGPADLPARPESGDDKILSAEPGRTDDVRAQARKPCWRVDKSVILIRIAPGNGISCTILNIHNGISTFGIEVYVDETGVNIQSNSGAAKPDVVATGVKEGRKGCASIIIKFTPSFVVVQEEVVILHNAIIHITSSNHVVIESKHIQGVIYALVGINRDALLCHHHRIRRCSANGEDIQVILVSKLFGQT